MAKVANVCFALAFALEAAIKITATGLRYYWSKGGNRFDGLIALTGLMDMLLDLIVLDCRDSVILRFVRALRAFRTVRILDLMKDARTVISASIIALTQLMNVSVILVLTLFILSNLGVALFACYEKRRRRSAPGTARAPPAGTRPRTC